MKATVTKLTIIFVALLLGQIAFFSVVHFLLKPKAPIDQQDDIFLYILPIIMVFALTTGGLFSKQRFIESRKMEDLNDKYKLYITTSIIRMALLEGANLTAIVFYLLGGNQVIAIMGLVGLLAFISLVPNKGRLQRELALTDQDLI
jgi:hypothetical protein